MYQQGNFPLTEGQLTYNVSFSLEFPNTDPSLILTNVFNAVNQDPQLTLVGNITSRDQEGFTFELSTAPDSNNYVLSWMASDGLESNGITLVQTNGIPVANFPKFNNPFLPDNTLFPAILANGQKRSITVTWGNLKNFLVKSHTHLVEEISNASAIAKSFLTALTPSAARQVIDAAPTSHTHLPEQITESTSIGRALIRAADQFSARSLIAAAPAEHEHQATDIVAAPHVEEFLESQDEGEALEAIGAAASSHTHLINHISNAGITGKALLGAEEKSEAINILKAMPENGWRDGDAFSSTRYLNSSDYGKKFICSTTVTATIPIGLSGKFKIAFVVLVDNALTIAIDSGVSIYDYMYRSIPGSVPLKQGFYILEHVDINSFILTGYENSFQRSVSSANNSTDLRNLINLPVDEQLGITAQWATITNSIADAALEDLSNYTLDVNLPDPFSTLLLSSDLSIGKHYYIRNASQNKNLELLPGSGKYINFSGSGNFIVSPGEIIKVTLRASDRFEISYKDTTALSPKTIYVAENGSDTCGQIGNPDKPFRTITFALSKATISCNNIHVKAGVYTITTPAFNNNLTEVNYYFEPGAEVYVSSSAFILNKLNYKINVYGFGNFILNANSTLILFELAGEVYFEANRITASHTTTSLMLDNIGSSKAQLNVNYIQASGTATIITTRAGTSFNLSGKDFILGSSVFRIIGDSTASLSLNNGKLTVLQNLIAANSSTTGLFKLNLINSDVVQSSSSTDHLLKCDTCKVRISGFNSTIEGNYSDSSIYHKSGTTLISGVKIINPVYVDAGGLTLDGVSIEVGNSSDYCLNTYSLTGGFPISILKTCASNKEFNSSLNFIGGDLVIEPDFNL
jgi:hypothetical protein